MPRDLFPFEDDRALIERYLVRQVNLAETSHSLEVNAGSRSIVSMPQPDALCMNAPITATVCSFSEDGELLGYMEKSTSKLHYIVKVQNYILQVLGDPRRITMKAVIRTTTFAGQSDVATAPHLDDIEIPVDRPWVIAGSLTMLAHRAQQAQQAHHASTTTVVKD